MNKGNKIEVSVVIVTYNTLEMTANCIESIRSHTKGINYEIILVDNASTDGSREYFSKLNDIIYVYSIYNLGFGRGNNLGVERASGKYIFYLNSDTLLLNNAIKEFYDWMESQPEIVGCCGCILLGANNKPINSFQDIQSTWYFLRQILAWYHIKTKVKYNTNVLTKLKYPLKVGFVVGADMFIRRSCLEKCGQFDPDFFMYYEETEMQYRFHKNGYESWIIDKPKIKHLVGKSSATSNTNSQRKLINQLISRYLYLEKTHSFVRRYLIFFIHLLYLPLLPFKRTLPGEKRDFLKIILNPFKP